MRPFLILLSCAALLGCERGSLVPVLALPAPGTPVPSFRLPLLRGGEVTSEELRGHPTVIALWATDCGQSRRAVAAIEELRERYGPQGVRVLIVADDESWSRLRAVRDSSAMASEIAVAAGRTAQIFDRTRENRTANDTALARIGAQAGRQLRASFALPGFLVLDRSGRVVHRESGAPTEGTATWGVRLAVEALLAEPGADASPQAREPARTAPGL